MAAVPCYVLKSRDGPISALATGGRAAEKRGRKAKGKTRQHAGTAEDESLQSRSFVLALSVTTPQIHVCRFMKAGSKQQVAGSR